MEKIKFYNTLLLVMIISFIISIVSIFLVPDQILESYIFIMPWYLILFIAILCEIIFTLGLAYNAFKIKRYGWMIAIVLLGILPQIIFYFAIMKKEFIRQINI